MGQSPFLAPVIGYEQFEKSCQTYNPSLSDGKTSKVFETLEV